MTGMQINWGLSQPVDVSGAFMAGAQAGSERRTAQMRRDAMAAYVRDPKNSEAFDTLVGIDPSSAYQLRSQMEARAQAQQERERSGQFADAAGQYALAQIRPSGGAVNALLSAASPPAAQTAGGSQNALAALLSPTPAPRSNISLGAPAGLVASPEQRAEAARMEAEMFPDGLPPFLRAQMEAEAPVTTAANRQFGVGGQSAQGPVAMGDGEPQPGMSAEDAAFIRMAKIDPIRAMEMRGAARDRAMDALRQQDEIYAMAVQHLANVTDDAGYQQLIGALAQRFAPLGVDLRSIVPATYPGPDGIRALLGRAMTARDQIAAMDRADRLDADIADDEADNARADRNVDSQIASRGARTAIADRREARIAAGGGRGGGGGRRGRRPRRGGGGSSPTAVNPQTGERLVLRNGAWVAAD